MSKFGGRPDISTGGEANADCNADRTGLESGDVGLPGAGAGLGVVVPPLSSDRKVKRFDCELEGASVVEAKLVVSEILSGGKTVGD